MFDNFGDYMFWLLFTPLKRVKKSVNQFYIFCKVIGKLFDNAKDAIFRVRTESMILSASEVMLTVHGKDRDMPRLKGEGTEGYRRRLSMKAIIAEKAGTNEGLILAVKALGYQNVRIEPLYLTAPSRWAEAILWISGGDFIITDRDVIQSEINKVKPASAKISLAQEQVYDGTTYCAGVLEIGRIRTFRQV
ncbi:hypothetical protein [Caproicibacter sp.]|uniref:hypothetical protein n=1 Tax=Caproicibacter sp. TaxID=2814884 RepID=UPI003989A30C